MAGGPHAPARLSPSPSLPSQSHTAPWFTSLSPLPVALPTSPSRLHSLLPDRSSQQALGRAPRPRALPAGCRAELPKISCMMDPAGQAAAAGPSPSAAAGGGGDPHHHQAVQPLAQAHPPPPAHQPPPQQQLSRYESQKRRDWNTFLQYLRNHRPPLTLARCSGAHVIEFLKYLDQFGKTKVHAAGCAYFGQPSPPAPCPCPLRQAWGSLDALIGRLRAAYEESGHPPESNPFAARAVRIYLREVRDAQAKARGIPYEKKKRKRTAQAAGDQAASSSPAVAAARDAAAAAAAATGGEGSSSTGGSAAATTPPQSGRAGEITGNTAAAAAAPTTSRVQ